MTDDMKGITAVVLHGNDRAAYTGSLFGAAFPLRLEPYLFSLADALSPQYQGGTWCFVRLESEKQGFLMYPEPDDKQYLVRAPNQYEARMSAAAFGITCCLYAYSHLSFQGGRFGEMCATQYHVLREYARDHPEADAIFRACD